MVVIGIQSESTFSIRIRCNSSKSLKTPLVVERGATDCDPSQFHNYVLHAEAQQEHGNPMVSIHTIESGDQSWELTRGGWKTEEARCIGRGEELLRPNLDADADS